MKINKIILNNFGSYEGEASFDMNPHGKGNIVLIGGKNGTGKTTLFTAMRICLYGYMSMGYKNFNSFYIRAITKLINNNAKLLKPTYAEVSMDIVLNNGQGEDFYTLTRNWKLEDSLFEKFIVYKNGDELAEEEIADFEKYILSLIPPELFNLYFFDGEKIADFFLDEGSNLRIKGAFLTLCGYDTFDIMSQNFKRISKNDNTSDSALNEYTNTKDELSKAVCYENELNLKLNECLNSISDCEASITEIEKNYKQKGGITEEEWKHKLFILKEEEKKREINNSSLKKWANEIIPFIILYDKIEQLKLQIEAENKSLKYTYFNEIINIPSIKKIIGKNIGEIKRIAFTQYGDNQQSILNLSLEQSAFLLAQIDQILSFKKEEIHKCKKSIQKSLSLSMKLRKELENSSIVNAQEYMKKRAQLFEEKSALLVRRVELESNLTEQKELVNQIKNKFIKIQARLEEELKRASINDISSRAIVMLDKLQKILYRKQIEKVESFFKTKICELMSKKHFINDIYIDDNFITHIYRAETMKISRLIKLLSSHSEEQIVSLIGKRAFEKLKTISGETKLKLIIQYFKKSDLQTISLPLEIDKASLSNGEKQIFIMALYHSLVNLCNHEIPFVIDTPFARIDTEHRCNISNYFFSQLKGQVFILSTNEEINSSHFHILENKVAATYMLENSDNKRTVIVQNSYFEV